MFGRKSATPSTTGSAETSIMPTQAGPTAGKGRPTPSRKEAEAARLAKVRKPRTRKEAAAAERARRYESSSKMREAMRTGDDRYLPARDKGPVRRFVRDFVDSKFTIAELVLPLLVVTLVLGWSGSTKLAVFANLFMTLLLVVTAGNLAILGFGLRRELRRRWPDLNRRGLTYYALVRTLQLRILRMPKPQARIGQQLSDTYR
ncbi:MAG: DUF3043 domain-containing protein [Nocardioides sp.]|uniref:DUF3043 domain-containing protein n=1 Tax=Nocardioides sp. TaxID=35761 RepID=UPI0039E5A403